MIVAIDRQPVRGFDDVVTYLARSTEVGQQITLDVLRQQKTMRIKVTLMSRPKPTAQKREADTDRSGVVWLGIQGLTLIPEVTRAMQLPASQRGVLVEQVFHGSPADQAGIRGSYKPVVIQGERLLIGGDVLTAIDRQVLTQMEDLQAFIQQAQPNQNITVSLLRNGKPLQIQIALMPPAVAPQ